MNNQTFKQLQKSRAHRSNRTAKVTNWFGQKERVIEKTRKNPKNQLNLAFVDYGLH